MARSGSFCDFFADSECAALSRPNFEAMWAEQQLVAGVSAVHDEIGVDSDTLEGIDVDVRGAMTRIIAMK